jgi:ribosomal protein L22
MVNEQNEQRKTRIKPVQPTVIRDKKIIREVIAEIHRKPTAEDLAYLQETREILKEVMAE